MKKIKIIITGASGFIGSNLVNTFLNKTDFELVPLSRKDTKNIQKLQNYSEAPEGDVLIHLAQESYVNSQLLIDKNYFNNHIQTIDSLLNKNYKKIIYISSYLLYGDKKNFPHDVNDETFYNDSYTYLKKITESKILESNSGTVLRLSNVYGPKMSDKNVISKIINQANFGQKIYLDDLSPIRDFIWVNDVTSAILAIIEESLLVKNAPKLLNIGTGIGTSIESLAQIVTSFYKNHKKIIKPLNKTKKSSCIILDYSKTTQFCGWMPKISLELGLKTLMASRNFGVM